jgi:MFS family permease
MSYAPITTERRPAPATRAVAAIAPAVILVIGMVAAVNLAIPTLQASSLHPSVSGTAWIVDSYTLVFACLLIPAGSLGDRFGRKRGMLIGLGIFAAGSALAALAPNVAVLMCGRALSGVGAALVLPATLAVTLTRVEPADRPRAVALWSALTGIGGALGNLGGGLAVDLGGWRALFWAGVPIALGAAALIASQVPGQARHRDPVDGGGGVLLTAGTVALVYGIIDAPERGWGSWPVLGSLLLAVVLLAAFAWYETRLEHPMLDPRLFRLSGVRAGTVGIIALFFAMFGLYYVNAQYLQDVKGYSPLLTGVCILPIAILMPYASARSTRLAPLSGTIVHALPPSHAGVGSGLNSTTRELGSALGVAVLSTVLATRFASHLPAALRHVPGARGQTIQHSITAALRYAASAPSPAVRALLLHGTRDAFTSGTSVGLRIGAVLILLTAAAVANQYPREEGDGRPRSRTAPPSARLDQPGEAQQRGAGLR